MLIYLKKKSLIYLIYVNDSGVFYTDIINQKSIIDKSLITFCPVRNDHFDNLLL